MRRMTGFLDDIAYFISTNRRRFVLVFALLGIAFAAMGASAVFGGLVGLLGTLPQLALLFGALGVFFYLRLLDRRANLAVATTA